jgi:branched-chain amino acid transport system substrate-binding protein
VIKAVNKQGGIYIKEAGKKLPIKMKLVDTESNPTKAAEVASKLILEDKVDIMDAMYTPDVVNPIAAVCERFKVPCIGLVVPIEAWLPGGPYHWSFQIFWSVDTVAEAYISTWDMVADRTNKVVGFFFPNDPDGVTWSEIFAKKLPKRGYRVVDPGRFPYFTKDFSSMIKLFQKEKVEILGGVPIPPDWVTFWKQCHQQGFFPKVATQGKAMDFPSTCDALPGDLSNGLTVELSSSDVHRYYSSVTGESVGNFMEAYMNKFNKYWNQYVPFTHAGYEVAVDALKRAKTLDKAKIREAIAQTDLKTIVGHVKFNKQNYVETPICTCQWVKGKRFPWEMEIIWNNNIPEIPITGKIMFPLPRPKR